MDAVMCSFVWSNQFEGSFVPLSGQGPTAREAQIRLKRITLAFVFMAVKRMTLSLAVSPVFSVRRCLCRSVHLTPHRPNDPHNVKWPCSAVKKFIWVG